jgi:hypothetical protein
VEVDFFGVFHVHICEMFYRSRLCRSNLYI